MSLPRIKLVMPGDIETQWAGSNAGQHGQRGSAYRWTCLRPAADSLASGCFQPGMTSSITRHKGCASGPSAKAIQPSLPQILSGLTLGSTMQFQHEHGTHGNDIDGLKNADGI